MVPFGASQGSAATLFDWDYARARPALAALRNKAVENQWNTNTDIDWSIPVDVLKVVADGRNTPSRLPTNHRSLQRHSTGKAQDEIRIENLIWSTSQFLHGEQAALVCAAKVVQTVPWFEAKQFAALQVADEARHVEVFDRYISQKLGARYDINPQLRSVVDDIVSNTSWDVTYLGMQVLVESLALASFGLMRHMLHEPLLASILRRVMADEARHVSFGLASLSELYNGLSDAEIAYRQEFLLDAIVRLREQSAAKQISERMGAPFSSRTIFTDVDHLRGLFDLALAGRVIPNCGRLGLLDRNRSWLRRGLENIGFVVA